MEEDGAVTIHKEIQEYKIIWDFIAFENFIHELSCFSLIIFMVIKIGMIIFDNIITKYNSITR